MPNLRAGVIGAGEMGARHVGVLAALEDIDLVGVSDPDPDSLSKATRGRTAAGYTDAETLLAEQRLDLAVIAVPTVLHEPAAMLALRHGVNILIEKPVAPDLAAATRIARESETRGLLAMVGHVERFNPAVLKLRDELASGRIGRIFEVVARRTGPLPARVKDVGVIRDLATHDLDVTRFVAGSPFTTVYARVARHLHEDHEDLASVLGELEDGTIVSLEVNWLTPTKVRQIQVVGEGGMFVVDYLRQDLTLFRNAAHRPDFDALETFTGVAEGEVVTYQLSRKEPLREELEAFAAAVRGGGPVPVPIEDAAETLKVAEAILLSSATGAPVGLNGERGRGR
jgi:predicted dehydrogenase